MATKPNKPPGNLGKPPGNPRKTLPATQRTRCVICHHSLLCHDLTNEKCFPSLDLVYELNSGSLSPIHLEASILKRGHCPCKRYTPPAGFYTPREIDKAMKARKLGI